MILEFLGTRGYIKARTQLHFRHSSCRVSFRGRAVVIDCGEDWQGQAREMGAEAFVVTHAHPDHAFGLRAGAPCPVYATSETWESLADFRIRDRRVMPPRQPQEIAGITFEAFPVVHSTRAPATGYRVSAGGVIVFYVPDVISIPDRDAALAGARVYIGDGASVTRPQVRQREGSVFGHTTVRAQLGWCLAERVPRAIFTHCGTEITEADPAELVTRVAALGRQKGVEAMVAHDGLKVTLR